MTDQRRDPTRALHGGAPLPEPASREREPEIIEPALDARTTVTDIMPGSVLATPTEHFLIIRALGTGGTAQTFVAVRLTTAQFAGTTFPLLPPIAHTGIHPMLPRGHHALEQYELTEPVCCLKVFLLDPNEPFYDAFLERMRQEAAFLARMGGKQFPMLIAGGNDPIPWMALEYIRGETLEELIARYHPYDQRVPWRRALAIMTKLAHAVDLLHDRGIVHRDLKPQNVVMEHPTGTPALATDAMVDDEFPRIIDLGISKAIPSTRPPALRTSPGIQDRGITRMMSPDIAMFTPGYGAPEQVIAGAEITTASDVFALGAMAYELLAGILPFADAQTPAEWFEAVRQRIPPIQHRELSGPCRERLYHVIGKALAERPHERYQRASEFADALRAVFELEDPLLGAAPAPGFVSTRTPTPVRRRATPIRATPRNRTPSGLQVARKGPPPQTGFLAALKRLLNGE